MEEPTGSWTGQCLELFFDFDFNFGHIQLVSSCVSNPTWSQQLQFLELLLLLVLSSFLHSYYYYHI